jgi:hypothetical protein
VYRANLFLLDMDNRTNVVALQLRI